MGKAVNRFIDENSNFHEKIVLTPLLCSTLHESHPSKNKVLPIARFLRSPFHDVRLKIFRDIVWQFIEKHRHTQFSKRESPNLKLFGTFSSANIFHFITSDEEVPTNGFPYCVSHSYFFDIDNFILIEILNSLLIRTLLDKTPSNNVG